MMFVVLVYDVNIKRVAKVRKTAEKYLQPVQKSVFEGFLTESTLAKLQKELERIIDCEIDSVLIYKQTYGSSLIKSSLGKQHFHFADGSIL